IALPSPRRASFERFSFADGTALTLQIGHRVSVDVDLFTTAPMSGTLLPKVKRDTTAEAWSKNSGAVSVTVFPAKVLVLEQGTYSVEMSCLPRHAPETDPYTGPDSTRFPARGKGYCCACYYLSDF